MNPFSQGENPFADKPAAMVNPYAPPQMPQPMQEAPSAPGFAGLWRQRDMLIMHKEAPLPPICLKSNQPASQRLVRKLSWHTPWIALTILISPLIYIVLALILTKRVTVLMGLSNEWIQRRRTRMWITGGLILFAAAIFGLGIMLMDNQDGTIFLICFMISIITFIGAAIYGKYACRMIYPDRISDTHAWIKGVHPDFLDRLPVWSG